MGLFSFGNKSGARHLNARNKRSQGGNSAAVLGEKFELSSVQYAPQTMPLDPLLPEKQRARGRLIGALVLVVAAVIVLPMVFDSRPPPVNSDHDKVAIQIRARTPLRATSSATAPATVASSPSSASFSASAAERKRISASPYIEPATAGNLVNRSNSLSSSSNARFVIQLATFSDQQRARAWLMRLKQAKIPAYLVKRKEKTGGGQQFLLRAGPFNDRTSAEAALKQMHAAGLVRNAPH